MLDCSFGRARLSYGEDVRTPLTPKAMIPRLVVPAPAFSVHEIETAGLSGEAATAQSSPVAL
jgi:hypothetical protein